VQAIKNVREHNSLLEGELEQQRQQSREELAKVQGVLAEKEQVGWCCLRPTKRISYFVSLAAKFGNEQCLFSIRNVLVEELLTRAGGHSGTEHVFVEQHLTRRYYGNPLWTVAVGPCIIDSVFLGLGQ
jgi:hypothetical protein